VYAPEFDLVRKQNRFERFLDGLLGVKTHDREMRLGFFAQETKGRDVTVGQLQ
jgi:hypothetical protein